MSLYLLFDVGNTRLKWAAIESAQHPSDRQKKLWAFSGAVNTQSLYSPEHRQELADYIGKTLPRPDAIAFCCVAGEDAITPLKALFPQWSDVGWHQLLGNSQYEGVRTLYAAPNQLGADRWAAIIGARSLSKMNTLIVNAGTASTIDLLGGNGLHYGGWILPGFSLMQESLQNKTANLPLVSRNLISPDPLHFGLSTEEAIIGGCDAAQIGAILRATQLAKTLHHPIERIWLDGGNAKVLAQAIQQQVDQNALPIDVIEGLVLRGLWAWLLQQV
jgi:type III pantothenate kinase